MWAYQMDIHHREAQQFVDHQSHHSGSAIIESELWTVVANPTVAVAVVVALSDVVVMSSHEGCSSGQSSSTLLQQLGHPLA